MVLISESLARRNWPHEEAIGKHLKLGTPDSHEPQREIVGVVGDIRASPFANDPYPATYVPLTQVPMRSSAFVVRTAGDPRSLAATIASQVRNIDSDAPAYYVRSLEQVVSDNASGVESSARMMLIFVIVALTLAAAGIFAVMAYAVAQRTHEIGVRMALGAQKTDVLRLIVGSAFRMTAAGVALGLVVAILLARALTSALFGVVQLDPQIFVLLTALLATVAAVAAYIPARRAAKVDPMVALRYE